VIKRGTIFLLFYLFISLIAEAQPLNAQKKYSPKKATLLSLIPGGGQIYNRKYWKVPIIYGGFALLIYSYQVSNAEYQRFKLAYKQSTTNQLITDPELTNIPGEMLLNVRDYYMKNRDLTVFGMAGLYALNLVDAAIDAQLKSFDVSDNLSVKIKPSFNYCSNFTIATVQLQFSLH